MYFQKGALAVIVFQYLSPLTMHCGHVSRLVNRAARPLSWMAAWHLCASAILPNNHLYQGWAFILFPRGWSCYFDFFCIVFPHYKDYWNGWERSKLTYFLAYIPENLLNQCVGCPWNSHAHGMLLFKTPSPRLLYHVLILHQYRPQCLCLKEKSVQCSKWIKKWSKKERKGHDCS